MEDFGDQPRVWSNSSRHRSCRVLQVPHAPDTAGSTSARLPQQPKPRRVSRRVQCRGRSDSRPSDGLPDLTCLCAGASALGDVLKKVGDRPVRVFVVWESVLWTDFAPPTSKVLSLISASSAQSISPTV